MDKVLRTLTDVRAGIERESVLIARALWDKDKNPCAIGATVPREFRKYPNFAATDYHHDRSKWDDHTIFLIIKTNNAFEGTPEERRNYMLAWVDEQIANHKRSDLAVPEFKELIEV